MFEDIRMGDKVKYLRPNGIGRHGAEWKAAFGRVVFNMGTHLVLNIGGRFGTPAVVTAANFLEHIPAREAH